MLYVRPTPTYLFHFFCNVLDNTSTLSEAVTTIMLS